MTQVLTIEPVFPRQSFTFEGYPQGKVNAGLFNVAFAGSSPLSHKNNVEFTAESSSESSDDSDSEDTSLRVSFAVENSGCFRFGQVSRFTGLGYQITDQTLFLPINIAEQTSKNVTVWNLKNIPFALVKEALENDKTVELQWQNRDVSLRFTEEEGMTKEEVLTRIREVSAGIGITTRDILLDEEVDDFIASAYMPLDR